MFTQLLCFFFVQSLFTCSFYSQVHQQFFLRKIALKIKLYLPYLALMPGASVQVNRG